MNTCNQLIQEGFKESYRKGVKFIYENVTIIFVSLEKKFQNKNVEIHKNFRFLSNYYSNSKLGLNLKGSKLSKSTA